MTATPSSFTISTADQQDIDELERRILAYKKGQEDEERFRHYRLTRGVYGQRQFGVQMFRTKIPFGHLTPDQLIAIADISERYTNGRLHLTTRQNIQLHYVKLEDSPAVWEDLATAGMTAREACGNTVRNLTASPMAGIDPNEPFDVSPYVYAAFDYFLRNPICQEMGRKIKPAFSSSELDSAFTYFHDFGFIPRIQEGMKGFKVVVGGGLGAVSMVAQTAYEFLPANQIIPFMEAAIRVFDRYGEREKRMKARMKFLLKKLGLARFMELVQEEWPAIQHKQYTIDDEWVPQLGQIPPDNFDATAPLHPALYEAWLKTNVVEQKQGGYRAVAIRIPLGNLEAEQSRLLAELIRTYASDDIRLTINQGMLLRYVPPTALPHLFNGLYALQLALPGFNTSADITACPGTDTCALGVTNSTGLAAVLEDLVQQEYPAMVLENDIRMKISGCMNACGQHMAANIGFHGSSLRVGERIAPAMQIVLGGGIAPDGRGFIAQKVIKLPTRRIPRAVRRLFVDYQNVANEGEYYNDYVVRQGKRYFYDLLKDLGDTSQLQPLDFQDWGQEHDYRQEIGVGECAGVSLDLVSTILQDGVDKMAAAQAALQHQAWSDAAYHAYSAMVVSAKALLLAKDVKCNTHRGIITDFDQRFAEELALSPDLFSDHLYSRRFQASGGGLESAANVGDMKSGSRVSGNRLAPAEVQEEKNNPFEKYLLSIKSEEPTENFASAYVKMGQKFVDWIQSLRTGQLAAEGGDKLVVDQYYKA